MGLTLWVATTRRDGPACQRRSETGWGRLWERRSVEKSFGLSHLAWKSRPHRGIPTFPQSRRRCFLNLKPDISRALKSGHFNLLTTGGGGSRYSLGRPETIDPPRAARDILHPTSRSRILSKICEQVGGPSVEASDAKPKNRTGETMKKVFFI